MDNILNGTFFSPKDLYLYENLESVSVQIEADQLCIDDHKSSTLTFSGINIIKMEEAL